MTPSPSTPPKSPSLSDQVILVSPQIKAASLEKAQHIIKSDKKFTPNLSKTTQRKEDRHNSLKKIKVLT